MIDATPFTECLDHGAPPEAVAADPALDTACDDGDFDAAAVEALAAVAGPSPLVRLHGPRSPDASRG